MGTIASRIRQLRKHLGITQKAMADAVEVDRAAVTNWEKFGNIKRENILKLVKLYGVSFAWLAEGEGEMGDPQVNFPLAERRLPAPTGYVSEADALVGFETLAHLLGIAQSSAPRVAELLLQAVLSQQEGVYPEDRAALIRREIRDAIRKSLDE